uniref:Tetratricopeptide repeat-containing protein n=1 Tax=Candidatus Kentrum sp. LFY TaxID=2126342 RepID=A0A450WKA8_9GAMM|nr:MAG: Tetratricopeptide repeat-containing protein [Candidatus Kentron sp. LFY]
MLTIASTNVTVLSQPWELMQDANGLLTFRGVTIRRQLRETKNIPRYGFQRPPQITDTSLNNRRQSVGSQEDRNRSSLPRAAPLRILLIVARPKDAGFIDPRNSIPPILDAVESLPGQVEVDFCEPPTLAELQRRIRAAKQTDRPYHIVHFDGHGSMMEFANPGPDQPAQEVVLCFEDDAHRIGPVTGRRLGGLLAENHIPVVILEACRGAYLSDREIYTSVAPALLEGGVGSVVAFSHTVHIEAARILVEHFYRELVAGSNVGKAVDLARKALHKHPQRWLSYGPDAETLELADWFIPQLYQAGDDPVLLHTEHRASTPLGNRTTRSLSEVEGTEAEGLPGAGNNREPTWKRWMKAIMGRASTPLGARTARSPSEGEGSEPQQGAQSSSHTSHFELHPSFPPLPQYRFHGRAPELLELERAFRRHPAVLLHAMGGMGKTALAREAAHWWLRKGAIGHAVFHSFERLAGAERVVQVLGQAIEGDSFSALSSDEQWRRAVELFHEHPVLLVWDNFESTLPQFAEPQDLVGWSRRDSAVFHADSAGDTEMPDDGPDGGIQRAPKPAPLPGQDGARAYSTLQLGDPSGDDPITGFSDESRELLLRLYRELTAATDQQRPKGKLLITCRPGEIFLSLPDGAKLELQGLHPADALYLLRAVMKQKSIDPERPGYERFQIDDLLKMLAWHPLSIELVTPHLKDLAPEEIRDEFARHLERFVDEDHPEKRNRSLLASLGFSVGRLSPKAREVLPLLGWFRGGVLERFLLQFTELGPAAWESIRAELAATALIRVEEVGAKVRYLTLHPTLTFFASPEPVGAERFLAVYLGVTVAVSHMLRGQYPTAGMAAAMREEGNLRYALTLAFDRGKHQEGWRIAATLGDYLERAGRLRERDALLVWVKEHLPLLGEADEAACDAIRQHAWSLFEQGEPQAAREQLEALLARLQRVDGGPFQIAMTQQYLGRIHIVTGRSRLALPLVQAAIAVFEQLGEKQRGNLAAILGDLCYAYRDLGHFGKALAAAGQALTIVRELGHKREVATALGVTASILMAAQRHAEAEQRYLAALATARRVGDAKLEADFLQHLGGLYHKQGRHSEARQSFQEAIRRFQVAGNREGEISTCDLLATAERDQGRLDEAEAWYARAREMAEQRRDQRKLAATAHNLSVLYLQRAIQETDSAARAAWLEKAVASTRAGLGIFLAMRNEPDAASSWFQLGVLCQLSGDLKAAEENTRQALVIYEPLNHPHLLQVYDLLIEIARARGDEAAAGGWQTKRDAKIAELEQLWAGG